MPTPHNRRGGKPHERYHVPRKGGPNGWDHTTREMERPLAGSVFNELFSEAPPVLPVVDVVRSPAQSPKFERRGAIVAIPAPKGGSLEDLAELERTRDILRASIGLLKQERDELRQAGALRAASSLDGEIKTKRNRLGKLNKLLRYSSKEVHETIRGTATTTRQAGTRHFAANVSHRKFMD